jgi:hypothetical protein
MGTLFWTLVAWAVMVVVAFMIYQPASAFLLFLALGGNGRKWFRSNAYFYTTASAVVSGLLWGLIMGAVYLTIIKFLHPGVGLSIGLVVWGFLATAYSGFARVPWYMRDGSHENLIAISGISSMVYLAIAIMSLVLL